MALLLTLILNIGITKAAKSQDGIKERKTALLWLAKLFKLEFSLTLFGRNPASDERQGREVPLIVIHSWLDGSGENWL